MADPLTLLREFTKNKRPVIFENEQFRFDGITFPRDVITGFHSHKGERQPYTLDAVWFMLKNADLKYTDYLTECRKYNFPRISLIDKRDLISYLTGETDSCTSIKAVSLPVALASREKSELKEVEVEKPDIEVERATKKQKVIDDKSLIEEKKKLAEKLNQPKVKPTNSDSNSSNVNLGSGLDAEKVTQLRKMRLLHKRSQVKDDEDIPSIETSEIKFIEADAAITKEIIAREKLLRTRNSILQSNKKHFTSIIDTVTRTMRTDALKSSEQKPEVKPAYDRYGDVHETQFWKSKLKGGNDTIEELGIDTRGGFADMGKLDVTNISQPKQKSKQVRN